MANMIIEDGVILAGQLRPGLDVQNGHRHLARPGQDLGAIRSGRVRARSPVRFQPKNSDGWFRVDLRKGWIERAEVLFIKPKPE